MDIKDEAYEKGWVCPKCGAVMSPRQMWCINCRGSQTTFIAGVCGTAEPLRVGETKTISSDYNIMRGYKV